ncbi:LLM class flavin-dependent oxidoreductase [Actinomadura parmotrematis]|uniref:LLM class flavin-dependent oxidoreductase n=1 Tax=Actinomadura parmotrematis TaxID=2864039 RepID=A0ABS7G3G5_9ACTN|nr:LLM class flavin-dependent oxidoreductase [Actinomadura parmotrematis]MBW8486765.1 LLM class flavin-dependent oxidoreductase [Actinomadura parmotrematis]
MTIDSLAFLSPGNYADDDPAAGLEDTLRLFEFGEAAGFDGAWIRQRHLEHGVSSAPVFLAAASQRTSRIRLGTAVIPIGYENPFRLAEDLTMLDALAHGRLEAGFSTGMPHAELLADIVHDGDWRGRDLSYGRIGELLEHLRGDYLGGPDTVIHSPGNVQRPRLQPHRPELLDRVWYGATSLRSARWAAEHGMNLLTGNIVHGETSDDFVTAQVAIIEEYRRLRPAGRIALGRVVVPLDGADAATRRRYLGYAAARHDRTLRPHGDRRTLFAPDLVGTAAEIVERLAGDAAVAAATELRLELPYEFDRRDYEQILQDVRASVAPHLGWRPDRTEVPA